MCPAATAVTIIVVPPVVLLTSDQVFPPSSVRAIDGSCELLAREVQPVVSFWKPMPIVTADISGVWIVHFAETIENSTVTAHKNGRLRVAENILE